jgi:hypothetical protein
MAKTLSALSVLEANDASRLNYQKHRIRPCQQLAPFEPEGRADHVRSLGVGRRQEMLAYAFQY